MIAALAFDDPVVADPAEAIQDLVQLREECLARANLYRILAGVFVEEPSTNFLAALREAGLLQSLRDVGIAFDADFLESDLPTLSEALACEYATLFASSGGFPPIESVRLTGRFKQDPHFQVMKIYQRMGFEQVKGRFEVFPDQLGIELMFVAELLERGAAALAREDMPAYKKLEKEIKRFWTLHLGRWVRGYSGLIERAAGHSFYREMARFLGGFAMEEIAAMGLSHLDDLDQGQLEVPKSEIKMEFNPDEPVCGECPPGLPERGAGLAAARVIPITPLHDLQLGG
ncbi:MAG: molecular chaperone TorD family protein [Polaromonas sp.]|uniref:TorD/DmsD family molecular chaperone n=1 Tax=Polaromonas sp. TaxID=1869339 RepID=UPI0027316836|nr:molecular chaperone TorD family protein [Polaromonas sp.]MDP2255591.1 molecular chaperone TorD family protein [Polaromonas sp.]MDP3707693.1 molecular chaperone TorD family protein [Polaromonas sp.]